MRMDSVRSCRAFTDTWKETLDSIVGTWVSGLGLETPV